MKHHFIHTIRDKCSRTVNCSKLISSCGTKPDILIIISSDTGWLFSNSSPSKFPKTAGQGAQKKMRMSKIRDKIDSVKINIIPLVLWLMVDINVVFPEPLRAKSYDIILNKKHYTYKSNLINLGPIIPRRFPHSTFPLTEKTTKQ